MRTYAKFVFITHICFLLTVVFRFVETRQTPASSESLLWSPLQSSLVVLGYSSVLFSSIFSIWLLQALYRKKDVITVPSALRHFNLACWVLQLLYFLG